MGLTMRPSHPTLVAVSRALGANRDALVQEWLGWTVDRMVASTLSRPTIERQLALLVDVMIEMASPLRRQALELWLEACETYGRTAAERGLVEEIQHLRELMIRHLSEMIAALPARASMATILRLNRVLDKGISHAVVGYTDALVETLFNQRGVPVGVSGEIDQSIHDRLAHLETELADLRSRTT
jgi:hypothetical protein